MASFVDLNSVVRRDDSVLTQELEGDIVIADLESGSYFGLGKSGKRIWELIDARMSVEQICDALTLEYDVDRAACQRDVLAFVALLLERGIVKSVERAGEQHGAGC